MKTDKNRPLFLTLALFAGWIAAMVWAARLYLDWDRYGHLYPIAAGVSATIFIAFAFAAARAAGMRGRRLILRSLAAAGMFAITFFGASFGINILLNGGMGVGPRLSLFAACSLSALTAVLLLANAAAPARQPRWRKIAALAIVSAVLVTSGVIQYNDARLPLLEPVFSSPDLLLGAERIPGTNEFRLDGAQTFNTVLIVEKGSAEKYFYWGTPFKKDGGADSFILEAFVDGGWQMVHRGEKIQTLRLCGFDAVTTDRVRVVAQTAEGEAVQIQSLSLYNEPRRKNPGLRMSTYYAFDSMPDGTPLEVAILARGEEYARNYARWFDVYDTVICIGGTRVDVEKGCVIYDEGEERYTERVNAVKELIALRGNPGHEVKMIWTAFGGGTAYADPILRDHMDALLRIIWDTVKKFGFDGVDVDYETPSTRAQWRRYDTFMARLDDGLKESNPDAILSTALFSWGMGMSRETLERLDQIQYMDYCEQAMPTLEGMQRGVARMLRKGAAVEKILIGLGTHGYDRNENWKDLVDANYYDCIYPENKVGCSPALAGDAAAYALFSGAGGVMTFVTQADRPMSDPVCMARGIEDALRRYVTS